MIGYEAFAELSQSKDCEKRGQAAHLAALAYLDHSGPADEHAALYAALIAFLDDTSVKVRAALAYGLLHSHRAPRPVILALLQDSAIISRAVLQYSPVLIDADLLPLVARSDLSVLAAISQRQVISTRLAAALLTSNSPDIVLRLLRRPEVAISGTVFDMLAVAWGDEAVIRGAMLKRLDLPGTARLVLVRKATESIKACRLVKGALVEDRLDRVFRNSADTALSVIGEAQNEEDRGNYVGALLEADQINARLLIHAVVTGRAMFFAACLSVLADTNSAKVLTLLQHGSRAALDALFARGGLTQASRGLLIRIVMLARTADLADDDAARHYVITTLTEEMIAQFSGEIPEELEEAFCYLNEQNIALARKAARGVMAAFVGTNPGSMGLPAPSEEQRLQLPAA